MSSSCGVRDVIFFNIAGLHTGGSDVVFLHLIGQPVDLVVGMNEIKSQKYRVKQNPARNYGMCYVILPDQMWMKPFQDDFLITIYIYLNNDFYIIIKTFSIIIYKYIYTFIYIDYI